MEIEAQIKQALTQAREWLDEQPWFQQLKQKWEELDPQSQSYLRWGSVAGALGLMLYWTVGTWWGVHNLKNELDEKTNLIGLIQGANDEMRRLRESMPGASVGGMAGEDEASPWGTYLETMASTAGIDKASLTVGTEKPFDADPKPVAAKPSGKDAAKDTGKKTEAESSTVASNHESSIEVAIKHVNIKQVVRYAFQLENGARPIKLRNLAIDTKNDPSGYMDATLTVSAFSLKP